MSQPITVTQIKDIAKFVLENKNDEHVVDRAILTFAPDKFNFAVGQCVVHLQQGNPGCDERVNIVYLCDLEEFIKAREAGQALNIAVKDYDGCYVSWENDRCFALKGLTVYKLCTGVDEMKEYVINYGSQFVHTRFNPLPWMGTNIYKSDGGAWYRNHTMSPEERKKEEAARAQAAEISRQRYLKHQRDAEEAEKEEASKWSVLVGRARGTWQLPAQQEAQV